MPVPPAVGAASAAPDGWVRSFSLTFNSSSQSPRRGAMLGPGPQPWRPHCHGTGGPCWPPRQPTSLSPEETPPTLNRVACGPPGGHSEGLWRLSLRDGPGREPGSGSLSAAAACALADSVSPPPADQARVWGSRVHRLRRARAWGCVCIKPRGNAIHQGLRVPLSLPGCGSCEPPREGELSGRLSPVSVVHARSAFVVFLSFAHPGFSYPLTHGMCSSDQPP
ncbi:uncharacterized protein LOC119520922 isoform X2 [Choloepus didactylus]|uniref:uncharacterized protein LOC119520922 isoform X2 n=1 Tax=Choloepus didactylus TaxID=27675 RepID=UPI00189CCFAE|nr:uncharacterized protein LOC119520922 isoform X2 [Choloepus didactylus]XP_037674709.1 uncharacterized protein LOC119520922 isoform X2 [Choloepus didactylus]